MRTLWIVNHYAALPTEPIAGARHHYLGRQLLSHQWQTVIVGAAHQHGGARVRTPPRRLTFTQCVDGVVMRWIRTNASAGNGAARLMSMILFSFAVATGLGVRGLPRPAVVIGSSVHPLAAAAAWVQARRFGVPFVFEIRDLWPETLIQMGALRRDSLAARMMRLLERWLCARATTVITTMPRAADYLETQGVLRSKVVWISNGVDLEQFPPPTHSRAPSGPSSFVYFGSLGQANGLSVLLEGFAFARTQPGGADLSLMLIGDGPLRSELVEQSEHLGIREAVKFHAPVSKSELAGIVGPNSILTLVLLPLALYDYGISLNKLFEYMALQRPILFCGTVAENPIEASNGGLMVDATPGAIADGMLRMCGMDNDRLQEWGDRNRVSAETDFSYVALARDLAAVLDS